MITAYLLLSAASAYSLTIFSRSQDFLSAIERKRNNMTAFNMAESAIDTAMVNVGKDKNYTGTSGFVALNSTDTQGGYAVNVTTPSDQPDVRIIRATGYAPNNNASSRGYVSRAVTAYITMQVQNYFDFAVFTGGNMKIAGTGTIKVDSYDSSVAPYNPLSPGVNGQLGTDSTAAGAVNLAGNVIVNGGATVGQGGDPSQVVNLGTNATLLGSTSVATMTRDYQPQSTSIGSSGSLNLSGNTVLTLQAGTYRFDSIDISGGASIKATGSVVIYVDGNVNMSGHSTVTSSNLPPELVMYVGGDDVKISGGSFFGGIYAPKAEISISGQGSMYGSTVGKSCDITGNGSLHYDEAMKNAAVGVNKIKLLAWDESGGFLWDTGTV